MKRKQIQILLILSAVAAALAILLAVLSREPGCAGDSPSSAEQRAAEHDLLYKQGRHRPSGAGKRRVAAVRRQRVPCFAAGCADACARRC